MSSPPSSDASAPLGGLQSLLSAAAALSSSSSPSSSSLRSLSESSADLLRSQPSAARDAVLAFHSALADLSVEIHVNGGGGGVAKTAEALLGQFVADGKARVEEDAPAWAPGMAQWALAVLGELSTKHTAKLLSRCGSSPTLHDSLSLWLDCSAARHLLSMVAHCLRAMSEEGPALTEGCISVLLDTSVKHSPHFDWVVAHVGGCFPTTVITRVLNVGLKEFCSSAEAQMKRDGKFSVSKVSKLNSVVGILGHLAGSHAQEIRSTFGDMLDESLVPPIKSLSDQAVGIIPFLLHLASLSDSLRAALFSHLLSKITVEAADKIGELTERWRQRFFPDTEALLSLAVNFALRSEESGREMLKILFELSSEDSDVGRDVRGGCRQMLDHTLCELQVKVHTKHHSPSVDDTPPLLKSFGRSYEYFVDNFIFSDDVFLRRSLVTLLGYLAVVQQRGNSAGGSGVGTTVLKYCLKNAEDEDDLGAVFEFVRDVELAQPDLILSATVESLKHTEGDNTTNLLRNLGKVLQYQSQPPEEQKIRVVSQFSDAVRTAHSYLLPRMSEAGHLHLVLKIFHFVPLSQSNVLDLSLVFRSAHCFSHSLFTLLDEESAEESASSNGGETSRRRGGGGGGKLSHEDVDGSDDENGADAYDAAPSERALLVAACVQGLQDIAALPFSEAGLPMVLRFLLEGALASPFSYLFGGKQPTPDAAPKHQQFTSLLEENHKFGSTPTHPLGAATVFHAGVIGRGRANGGDESSVIISRASSKGRRRRLKPDEVEYNQFVFLCTLFKICQSSAKGDGSSASALRHLALLLVEMVSPDVMFNGLPWPEEDFARVTIERDLRIAKTFEEHPVLWRIMLGVAEARPALCYCSVLVRALVATQINFWQSSVSRRASDNPKQLESLKKTLELMSVGQFLPHPLSSLPDVVGRLHAFHLNCVLVDVWNFMKEHVPTPAAFGPKSGGAEGSVFRDFEEHTPAAKGGYRNYFERLRLILTHHVAEVPEELKRFFVDVASKQEHDLKIAMDY